MSVLGDGNLLIGFSTEVQVEKAKKVISVGKVEVSVDVRAEVERFTGFKVVIC